MTLDHQGVVAHAGVIARVEGPVGVLPPDNPGLALNVGYVPLEGLSIGAGHATGGLDEAKPGKETGFDKEFRDGVFRQDVRQIPRGDDCRPPRPVDISVGGGRQGLWHLIIFVFTGAHRHTVRPK